MEKTTDSGGAALNVPPGGDPRVSIVIVTRNRAAALRRTLERLLALPEHPQIVVVDNASTDGTEEMVRLHFPRVTLIALPANQGCGARTVGARHVSTPYIAFSDDDSWWEHGSLARAADVLDAHPRLALVAARVLVGPEMRLDPACAEMRDSPLPTHHDSPGPAVLGFIACGAVVCRERFLEAGGFNPRFGIGGEETLLAIDLAAAGWWLAYLDDVIAYHHPSPCRDRAARDRTVIRNALWSSWLRLSLASAIERTRRLVGPRLFRDPAVRAGFLSALAGLPWVIEKRRRVPPELESSVRMLF